VWARGQLGDYSWGESTDTDLTAGDIVSALRKSFLGLFAVCSSWDSGMLRPDTMAVPGWRMLQGHAASEALTDALIDAWPQSDCGYDEWYLFQQVPQLGRLHAFCNWGAISLAQAGVLRELPSGFDLANQLDQYRPHAVIGDGARVFVIAPDAGLVTKVEHL
jgi:hypothetical protein